MNNETPPNRDSDFSLSKEHHRHPRPPEESWAPRTGSDPDESPFRPPSEAIIDESYNRLKVPGVLLMILSALTFLWWIFNAFIVSLQALTDMSNIEPDMMGFQFGSLLFMLLFYLVLIGVQVGLFLGGLHMFRKGNSQWAIATSIISLIPCLSPCVLMGIPIGIWCLVVIYQDSNMEKGRKG